MGELFTALHTRTCAECGTLTQYLDAFTMRRVCLSLNGYCEGRHQLFRLRPNTAKFKIVRPTLQDKYGGIKAARTVSPHFIPIMRNSQVVRDGNGYGASVQEGPEENELYYDLRNAPRLVAALADDSLDWAYTPLRRILRKSMSVTNAPWLDSKNLLASEGVRCPICAATDAEERAAPHPQTSVTKLYGRTSWGGGYASYGLKKR